ncbi:hypothetical protein B7G68_09250 [Caulobacter segnis]|uniref:Uncharacterized protein n=1 Tax=Caulobacter segnis TaxID=88688 RepID=A0ABN5ISK1_9CAUL|nr:hypothetical protein B7G68_09250 [Caulobacter segnis]
MIYRAGLARQETSCLKILRRHGSASFLGTRTPVEARAQEHAVVTDKKLTGLTDPKAALGSLC